MSNNRTDVALPACCRNTTLSLQAQPVCLEGEEMRTLEVIAPPPLMMLVTRWIGTQALARSLVHQFSHRGAGGVIALDQRAVGLMIES